MEPDRTFNYGIKSTLSQCLAMTGGCLVQIGMGVQLVCPTILIGCLKDNNDQNEELTITENDASWFGSLLFLFTLLGSLVSSLVLKQLDHNKCMIITNVPFLMSLVTLFFAENVYTLYVSSILMGLSVGFSGGPFTAYLGEICEPKLRGAMMAVTNVFFFAGFLLFTLVSILTDDWRRTVLLTMTIPVLTVAVLIVTPLSPIWLLSKGKTDKAQRTLCKIRGGENCSNEFHEIKEFIINSNKNTSNKTNNKDDSNDYWKHLIQPEVLKPFCLLLTYFFFSNIVSGAPYSADLVAVVRDLGKGLKIIDLDPRWILFFNYTLSMIAGILTVLIMNKLGKRRLTFWTLSICSFCYIAIGLTGVYLENGEIKALLILTLFLTTTFVSSLGILPIGWTLLSEIFPLKSKTITVSIGSTLPFVLCFFMTKFYPDFRDLVSFYNTFTILGVGGLIGCAYFYKKLPETENKTLQEISDFFKNYRVLKGLCSSAQ